MAHFAKLNETNLVTDVIVVNNSELDPSDEEGSGVAWLVEWSGGHNNWKQTSYNGQFRKNFAGIGYLYDPIKDAFIPPQPFNSWLLNDETCMWEAPLPMPTDGSLYYWSEDDLTWVKVTE